MTEESGGRRSKLSAAQKAVLERRIRDAAEPVSASRGIARRPDPDAPAPLSSAQQRLWVLDQLAPGNCWYNVTRTARIEGPLDENLLAAALDRVVARHESLRTTFVSLDGQPFQKVWPSSGVALSIQSLETLTPPEREPAALARALADAETPFQLAAGPLVRGLLLRLSPEHHVLHLTAHHIVTDGWSMELLFQELSAFYEAGATGSAPSLAPLSFQYADFCLWQRNWLESDRARSQMSHWAERLRGAAQLDLPLDRPRPPLPTFGGAHRTKVLPGPLLEGLTAVARRENATLFMVLLSAFEVFLYRHSGQDDVSVATPIAGRTLPELEPLIGFFVNTLVLRGDLSGNPSFREVVRRVRETALDSYAHQDVPLEKLVETLRPQRHLAQNPLAQTLFVLQNAPSSALRLSGADVTPIDLVTRTARFDLELHARETSEGLSCMLIGALDLFEEDTLDRLLERYETLLHSLAERPDAPIGTLDILPAAERRTLLDWNRSERDYRTGRQLQEFLELQARRMPEAPALEFEGSRLTYGELNGRANQFARHLRGLGVGPDVLVGICLERSLEMVVALLGVLKAGGAYVPLDPAYPSERLAFMLEDAQIRVLVTEARLEKNLPVSPEVHLCLLDREADMIAKEPGTDLEVVGSPENTAYVIYTSGSTGKPKGVLVTHANVDRLLTATEHWFGFDERDVWTLFHSYAFDFSVWEMWGALRYGGRLVVVPQLTARSPEAFHELLARSGVTVLNQTPSAFRQLIAADASSSTELSLRLVIFGGEALEPGMLRPWFERHGDTRPQLVNMYGITETTVHVTYDPVRRIDAEQPTVSVIGRAIPDLQVYVLDRHFGLCPIGVPGEIHVAGAGVARGYLRRPQLTAERFVPNPFGAGRLYRSGDLGRYRGDGRIEYLGRIDHQVKIRGHRIEPGEIETVLSQHPGVSEAVIVAREDADENRRLIAYIVGGETVPSISELRSFLKRTLPEYMIPSLFIPLERLPLTPSGKVDRKALPAPDQARPELEGAFTAPETPIEHRLAEIWSQILRIERVGRNDNFFDLGGHSLLATQLISRIRDQFAVELPLRLLFQFPTVAELAEAVSQAPAAAASIPIARLGRPSRFRAFETKQP